MSAPDNVDTPVTSRLREVGWYSLAIGLTVAILLAGLRVDRADFHAPFAYEQDALLVLPFVKETVEGGNHWHTPRFGAPGTQELHDFPVIDHLHLAIIWALGRFFPDPVVVFNLFHLLTYPLTTFVAMFVLRRFRLSPPAAIVGAILYSFQPYHYLRGQVHYFLSAYFIVPLTLMVTLWICQGRLPFFRKVEGRYRLSVWNRDALFTVVIAFATSAAGAYYAFFSCALLVPAGCYGWFVTRTWRAAASAWVVIALILLGGLANHVPTILYQYNNGQNSRPRSRLSEEAEIYGMKIAQVILPVAGHNPIGFGSTTLYNPAALRSMYQAPVYKDLSECDWDPFGMIGAIGYLFLLSAAFLPIRRVWPVGPLSALTVFATLLATIGGFGAIFNLMISSQVRCYNRISIFIAFLALFIVCWGVDRFFDRRTGWARRCRWPVFLGMMMFGIWDQTNEDWFPDVRIAKPGYLSVENTRAANAERYWADREFFEQVEELLPEGMVFTFPFMEYPESRAYTEPGAPRKIESYEMALGYLHTRNLRWSFGTMKGREWDDWMRRVSGKEPIPRFLERIAIAGFEGLLVDVRGLSPKHWNELRTELDRYLGQGALREIHPTRKLHFFDLRGYRDSLKRNYGQPAFDALVAAEHHNLTVLWLKGFTSYEPTGYEDRLRWCSHAGEVVFVNGTEQTVTLPIRMRFRTTFKDEGRLQIQSSLRTTADEPWIDDFTIGPDDKQSPYAREIVIPPGRHTVHFRCTPLTNVQPTDSRNHLFSIVDFRTK